VHVGLVAFAVVGFGMSLSAPGRAQSAEPLRIEMMDQTLAEMQTANQVSTGTTILYLVDAAALLTLGTAAALDSDGKPVSGGSRVPFSAGSLLLGSQFLVFGVSALVGTDDEDRLTRFRRQRANGTLDARALARYEGELRDAAASARFWRLSYAWSSLGVAVAGQALIGLTAAEHGSEDESFPVAGYLFGTVFLGVGAMGAYAGFAGTSPTEFLWKRYKVASQQEPLFEAKLFLAPWGSQGLVLGSTGRF
jgi:hypothetical protein